jgi:hypothetical protein
MEIIEIELLKEFQMDLTSCAVKYLQLNEFRILDSEQSDEYIDFQILLSCFFFILWMTGCYTISCQ